MIDSDAATSWLSRLLNLVGAGAVGFYLSRDIVPDSPVWVVVLAYVALAGWFANILLRRRFRTAGSIVLLVMVVAGGMATAGTNGLLVVPVVLAIVSGLADPGRPLWHGILLSLLGAAIVPLGIVTVPLSVLGLVSLEAGLALAFLAGISRRQFRAAEAQSRLLLEERIANREEQARGAALAERQAVARDIHDVLAHSLGGLVIQLDAVEALLEAGKTAEAKSRVTDARRLAVAGLEEARRAVGALREPREPATESGVGLQDALAELVGAHRALGGRIRFETEGTPREIAVDEAHALRRAMQEALTNARKHAVGEQVVATLHWTPGTVELEVKNPVAGRHQPAALPISGQHGLVGMAERFDGLADASLSAGVRGESFVVSARIGRS